MSVGRVYKALKYKYNIATSQILTCHRDLWSPTIGKGSLYNCMYQTARKRITYLATH